MSTKEFQLGLMVGGEQGQPDLEVIFIRTVEATTIEEAREKWKAATGKDDNGLVEVVSIGRSS